MYKFCKYSFNSLSHDEHDGMALVYVYIRRQSGDSVLSEMISSMKSNFDKYWGKIEDVNKLLIIALVLDPRYKLDYVKFCFGDMFDDKKTKEMTSNIRELLIQLYDCYKGVDNISSSDHTSSSISLTNVDVEKTNENANFRSEKLKKGLLNDGADRFDGAHLVHDGVDELHLRRWSLALHLMHRRSAGALQ
ncbi:hypothetical protein ACOSQ4_022619 [Xanthoceras sorbifolium]